MVLEEIGLGNVIPSGESLKNAGLTTFNVITWVLISIVVVGIIGVVIYLLVQNLKFNKKIEVFKKVGNRYEKIGKDRGMELKYGRAGDYVFYLRKYKKYLPIPEQQVGRNLYWFAIREDGEWINIGLEDIDFAMRKAKAKFLHKEVRYMRTGILRNLKDRLDKPKFMEKYGTMLISFGAIVIILFFMWMIIDKIVNVSVSVTNMVNTAGEVMEKANQVLASLDNVCSTSGMK